jgi:saccharopine dehydrogenase-like NADP-dependent oxidoreductase
LKTLVLGGYGNFGARICRGLAADFSNSLFVGGRSAQRAQAFANELGHGVQGVGIDLTSEAFPQTLRDLEIELLIHTAGPFQHQAYGVAQAAAAAGAHYVDLSDGRQFVCAFSEVLNNTFLAAGRTAISGASTVPALSSAVVDYLCKGWQRIDAIDTCIAPAQTAPRGKATLAGVLSYCGAPIQVWVEGQWQSRLGWAKPERITFSRLLPRKGALCDIPDLALFPHRYQVRQRVMFRAALEVGFTQYAFAALAALRSGGLIGSPAKLAGLLNAVSGVFDVIGSSLGGMVVRAEGLNAAGTLSRREWHIAADDDHGPEIPCMAAILLARRMASGEQFEPGAFTCTGMLELAEFSPEFARWGMLTDTVELDMHRDAQTA